MFIQKNIISFDQLQIWSVKIQIILSCEILDPPLPLAIANVSNVYKISNLTITIYIYTLNLLIFTHYCFKIVTASQTVDQH